jgi:hypothetical protein
LEGFLCLIKVELSAFLSGPNYHHVVEIKHHEGARRFYFSSKNLGQKCQLRSKEEDILIEAHKP